MKEIILNKVEILSNAKKKWNSKDNSNRIRAGSKYQHFLDRYKLKTNDWTFDFDGLSKHQQNVIAKGELIRTYDSLSNTDKTKIMREFGLSSFSSKWYKLSGADKKILLNYIIQ